MARFTTGIVTAVTEARPGLARVRVAAGDGERGAAAILVITGPVEVGDRVVLNTTASDLSLGSGGEDFVLWNLSREFQGFASGGHIIKLRYTGLQFDVMSAEAPESPHHGALARAGSIDGMPVVACSVHSQLPAAAAAAVDAEPGLKIAFVMTDGASLPLALSDTVAAMKGSGCIASTITCGHAFGGDLECVNVFSGLAAARHVAGASLALVGPGPGVVGTGTPLGHSAMDQGVALAAAAGLGGRPVAALRVSFSDERDRHKGLSHHSVAALTTGTGARCLVPVPVLEEPRRALLDAALAETGVAGRHDIVGVDAGRTFEAMEKLGLAPRTMGRAPSEDPEFFLSAGAAGIAGARMAG